MSTRFRTTETARIRTGLARQPQLMSDSMAAGSWSESGSESTRHLASGGVASSRYRRLQIPGTVRLQFRTPQRHAEPESALLPVAAD